jgi:methionyl-tRNA formyltransferase
VSVTPEPSGAGVPGPASPPARTLFLGSGGFAVPILDALVNAPEVDIVAVLGAPDRPAGRHGTPAAVPVVARARELGLPVLQPARLRAPETVAQLASLEPDLGVLADYGRIVPAAVLELPRCAILNVHPSLLPRHRGAAPIAGAILADDAETGVTIIRMDDGIDTGPIVAATSWPLEGSETAPELEARAAGEGAALLRATLPGWLAGSIEARPQDDAAATLTRPLRRPDGRLDPARPVASLERQVRALQPWPGTWAETVVGRLVVWRAEAVPGFESGDAVPGRFGRFGLQASDGHLALREVQPAGGRRMTWDEFVRGHPAIVGSEVLATDTETAPRR